MLEPRAADWRGVGGAMSTAELTIKEVPAKVSVFHHILVATDFSKASKRALSEALSLAEENDAQLSLVHVLNTAWRYEMLENPPGLALEQVDAQKRLTAFGDGIAPGQKIQSTLITHGPVAQSVAALALDQGTDLLVIGTRGRGGLSKLTLGSVAEELLRVAPCPVMAVGPKANLAPQSSGPRAILYATDFGKGSIKALPLASSLARARKARLILLHMMAPMPVNSASLTAYSPTAAAAEDVVQWESSSRQRCLLELKRLREELLRPLERTSGAKAQTHFETLNDTNGTRAFPEDRLNRVFPELLQEPEYVVGTDLFPEGILTAAEKFNVGLIVMGANQAGSAKMLAHIPWTAVHEVVRNAPCPVMTVAG